MKIAIITSKQDIASMNIREELIKDFQETDNSFKDNKIYTKTHNNNILNLYTLETETITTEDLDKEIVADLFIFATRHQSKQEIPSLNILNIIFRLLLIFQIQI